MSRRGVMMASVLPRPGGRRGLARPAAWVSLSRTRGGAATFGRPKVPLRPCDVHGLPRSNLATTWTAYAAARMACRSASQPLSQSTSRFESTPVGDATACPTTASTDASSISPPSRATSALRHGRGEEGVREGAAMPKPQPSVARLVTTLALDRAGPSACAQHAMMSRGMRSKD